MSWALLGLSLAALGQNDPTEPPPGGPPPRSDVESSSKDTKIDLSPPSNDQKEHPDGGIADDVLEFRSYNPHKAMKNVEVGDYYFKRKNYRAALSRYQEALEWKPGDAEATLRIGRALEKLDDSENARLAYEQYLKILPDGPYALEARKALERLASAKTESTKK